MRLFKRIRAWFVNLPNRKSHLDFFIALLSVPVLLTVIFTNVLNLQSNKAKTAEVIKEEKPVVIENKMDGSPTEKPEPTAPITPSENCRKEVGPVSITFPSEGQTVTDNPVCINIKYSDPKYCSVVWSYRINQGGWSDYNSNSVCLYNVPRGDVKFDLRVQSTVSEDETTLARSFKYQGESAATSSAQIN